MDSTAASRVRPAGESPLVEQITRAMQICYRAAVDSALETEEDCTTTDDDLPEEAGCIQPAIEKHNRKRKRRHKHKLIVAGQRAVEYVAREYGWHLLGDVADLTAESVESILRENSIVERINRKRAK